MKSNANAKTIILITSGILFALVPIITTNLSCLMGNSNKRADYSDNINLDHKNPQISAVSGKIHIDNNWTDAKTAGICTGEGTYSNPYIIEDLVIDGGGAGSCIFIENSNVYFKIENCTIYYSGPYGRSFLEAGIKLKLVSNGSLINNNVSNNKAYGIRFWFSNNNTISGNTVNNNAYGIYLGYSDRNTVSGNTVNNNGNGIYLSGSNNTILWNTANNNNENGIDLSGSSNNTISWNTANNNNENGIYLGYSDRNTVSGNSVNNNKFFNIRMVNSNYNIVSGNTLIGNYYCIYETDCHGNVFENNKCNAGDGISFELIILLISGGAMIGVATILLIRRTLKGNLKIFRINISF